MSEKTKTKMMHLANIFGTLLTIGLVVWGLKAGVFTDKEKMLALLLHLGIWGPLVFCLIQVAQTVIPIMPGAITIPIGVIAFGPYRGFLLNYFPIILGSIINFYLARRYGQPFVRSIVDERSYEKVLAFVEKKDRGNRFFTVSMFLPVTPADILCYAAGLTNMSFKYFFWSLVIGKPFSLAAYSLGTAYLFELFTRYFN